MRRPSIFSSAVSAELRDRLIDHLTRVFTDGTIRNYMAIDGRCPEWQIIQSDTGNALALPKVKMAFHIWLGMRAAHRYDVLGKFQCLYAKLPAIDPGERKTLIFCALFIHEFTLILAEAMEWPD